MRVLTLFLAALVSYSQTSLAQTCAPVQTAAISDDLQTVAYQSKMSDVMVLDLKSEISRNFDASKMSLQELKFRPGHNELIGVFSGPLYRKWNLADGSHTPFSSQTWSDGGDNQSAFSHNDKYLISSAQLAFGGWGYEVVDLDTQTKLTAFTDDKSVAQISDDGKTVYQIYGHEGQTFIAASITDPSTIIYNQPLGSSGGSFGQLEWMPNGHLLYAGGTLVEIDPATGSNVKNWAFDVGNVMAWSPDGSHFLTTIPDGVLFSSAEGYNQDLQLSATQAEGVLAMKLSADSKTAVVILRTGEIATFETATGKALVGRECLQ